MFDWIGDALSWVGDKFSDVGTAISEAVWDVMLEWLFNTIYGAVAEFFGMMNGMGADIFSQSWVSAFLQLFSLFGWTLFAAGLVVAVFDTAFHQTMPSKAYLYALPKEYYEKYGVRRYGFHGTSHSFVSKRLAELAGLDINNSRMIICHIGSGASISAIKDGKSVDTSMGMTPLEGLMMGTRSGDMDPAIIEFICQKENITVQEMTTILNKKSGALGLSGLSNDYRDLVEAAQGGNQDAINALDVMVYRVIKYIGAYYMALGGVDAIALTAGVGENNLELRAKIVEGLAAIGIKLDVEANAVRGDERKISTDDSAAQVWVVPTNEELAIARETARLVCK